MNDEIVFDGIPLDVQCEVCRGRGGSVLFACDTCDGKGYVKTQAGLALFEFIARHHFASPTPKPRPYNSYGYCPNCEEPGVDKERSITGRTTCKNGHKFPHAEFRNV